MLYSSRLSLPFLHEIYLEAIDMLYLENKAVMPVYEKSSGFVLMHGAGES